MTKLRLLFACAAALVVAMAAASSASAATITVPGGAITATSSGTVSLVKGATAIQSNVTLTGSITSSTYTNVTLGVTVILPIGAISGGTCTSVTAGFITRCGLYNWPIAARITGTNTAELRILNVGFLINNTDNSVQCLVNATVTGTYDRTTGIFTITGTATNSETALSPGICPPGSSALRATFRISPIVTWTLS